MAQICLAIKRFFPRAWRVSIKGKTNSIFGIEQSREVVSCSQMFLFLSEGCESEGMNCIELGAKL
jgi:hypothetical protein